MTWTNAFDAGECTVKVLLNYDGIDHEVYRSVMAKGASASFTDAGTGESYAIAVSMGGVVSLDGNQSPGTSGTAQGFQVSVIPIVEPTAARIQGIDINVGIAGTSQAWAMGNESDLVPISGTGGGTWSPDPFVLTSVPLEELALWANPEGAV